MWACLQQSQRQLKLQSHCDSKAGISFDQHLDPCRQYDGDLSDMMSTYTQLVPNCHQYLVNYVMRMKVMCI